MRDGIYAVRSASLKIPHNDLDAFERALKAPRTPGTNLWILVESVYSMDGDMAPVRELLVLAEKYDAMLIVDEAHGTGVCGARGRGATEELSDRGHDRLIVLHTCGKALGVAGALVCASEPIIDYLINTARPFVYSTAPMPLQAVLVQRALELVQEEPERRKELAALKAHVAKCLPGVSVLSQIVPIIIGGDDAAVALASALQAEDFDIRAIRPPTVPEGTARLRLSLRVGVTTDQLSGFAEALTRLRRQRLSA
jgi:8-amino-7-oxononanoate synthase